MKCSICIATVPNKDEIFRRVLDSIFRQKPDFDFEVIVAHDGAPDKVDIRAFHRIVRADGERRNPSVALNVAMRQAKGRVLILQSDDVIHDGETTISDLVELQPGTFQLARVTNSDGKLYVSRRYRRPLFFLGSVLREDVYAIGGLSEDFNELGYDDRWLADCLIQGRGLTPVYRDDVSGTHVDHPRPDLKGPYRRMRALYDRKRREAVWMGGPAWDYC